MKARAHEVLLRPFRLADRLVTNGEWLDFIERRRLSARRALARPTAGRASTRKAGRAGLLGAARTASVGLKTLCGLPAARPGGAGLPCQLLRGRGLSPAGPASACRPNSNGRSRRDGPARRQHARATIDAQPASAPARPAADFGDVWEWTPAPISPYPGYRPAAGRARRIQWQVHDATRWCCAARPARRRRHARRTYRNFFYPQRAGSSAGCGWRTKPDAADRRNPGCRARSPPESDEVFACGSGRTFAAAEIAAGLAFLRRAWKRAFRGNHPPARILSDPRRDRDPRISGAAKSPRRAAGRRSSSSLARAPAARPKFCWTPCTAFAHTRRSTFRRARSMKPWRVSRCASRRCASSRRWAISRLPWRCPRRSPSARVSAFSPARPSAISLRRRRAISSPIWRRRLARAASSSSASICARISLSFCRPIMIQPASRRRSTPIFSPG